LSDLPYQIFVAPLGQFFVGGACFLRLLLEAMQDLNGLRERGYIQYAKGSVLLANPNLPDARADVGHRFPVVGIVALLHLKQLEACFTTGGCRKSG